MNSELNTPQPDCLLVYVLRMYIYALNMITINNGPLSSGHPHSKYNEENVFVMIYSKRTRAKSGGLGHESSPQALCASRPLSRTSEILFEYISNGAFGGEI